MKLALLRRWCETGKPPWLSHRFGTKYSMVSLGHRILFRRRAQKRQTQTETDSHSEVIGALSSRLMFHLATVENVVIFLNWMLQFLEINRLVESYARD